MSAKPVLFQDQQVDLGVVANGETRWLASRVLASGERVVSLAWPLDTNRFLPVLLPVVKNDKLVLAARGGDGQLFAADAQVEDTDPDQPRLVMRLCSAWRPLDRRASARRSTNIRAQRADRLVGGVRVPIQVTIQNLSSGGLLLRSEQPAEGGDRIDLVFSPPSGGVPVQARVEVLRAVMLRTAQHHVWELGCSFEQLDDTDYTRLVAYAAAASAPRPRRWVPTLAGALLAGLMVLGGARQVVETQTRAEQPSALAALSARPVSATRTTADPAARATRSAASRSSSGQTWSAYGYAIQAPAGLWPALDLIRDKGGYDWVLDTLDASQTQVRLGNLEPRTMGVYNAQQNLIVIADALQTASVEVVAATLVHESTHLSDAQHGRWENSTAACLKFEQRAFTNEAAFWHALYGSEGKLTPADEWESALNNLLIAGDVSDTLLGAYADECGSLGAHAA
jgi:PilZ domain